MKRGGAQNNFKMHEIIRILGFQSNRPLQLLILCFFVAVWESGREKKTGMGELVRRSNFNYIVLLFSLFSQYQCPPPLTLRVRFPPMRGVLDTALCDKVCQWVASGRWFSLVSSTNKTDPHHITEIVLNTITIKANIKIIYFKTQRFLWNILIFLHNKHTK
jgi:hypothetical protein